MRSILMALGLALLASPSAAQPQNPPTMSKSEFTSIKIGMKYSEVVAIVGGEGELMSESESGRTRLTIYTWKGEGASQASGTIVFNNGRVMSKSQYGLT